MVGLLLAVTLAAADGGVDLAAYEAGREALATSRAELAGKAKRTKERPGARREAKRQLLRFVDDVAFPAWAGTPWDFYGTTQTPREGQIACGYFVSAVLLHAGFRVERVLLAQQASAYIVSTMARGTKVEWWRYLEREQVVKRVREQFGEGLFIVGLDLHVGFLRIDGEREDFCHSSFLEPVAVICEPAASAAAFSSNLYVVGDALSDAVVDDWLAAREIATLTPPRRGRAASSDR